MQINLIYDSPAQAAPQSFRDGMQTAANILDAAFDDNITVNIGVQYGEKNGVPLADQTRSEGSSVNKAISYTALRSDLAALATSPDDLTAIAAMPNTSAVDGHANFEVSRTQAKLMAGSPASARTTR